MPDIPTTEPEKITAGDTVSWKKSLPDHPAPDWVLSYALVNAAGQITLTASADGTDHLLTIASEISSGYLAGRYRWQAYATKGDERRTVGEGTIEVLPDFASQAGGYDDRSHAEQVLEALEAMIVGRAAKNQLSQTIRGRSIQYLSPSELIVWRDRYRAEVVRERRARRIKQGLGHSGIIKVRG